MCISKERYMFQLKSAKKESENKTIRFPIDLIRRIEKALVGKDATFSAFVIQACEYALETTQQDDKKKVNSQK